MTFPPGASLLSTSPEAAGSVTAVITTGISEVAPATACAAGVAIARIKSFLSFTSLFAIVCAADCSPPAFCCSISTSRPASLSAATKPSFALSSAGCCTYCKTPIFFASALTSDEESALPFVLFAFDPHAIRLAPRSIAIAIVKIFFFINFPSV